MKKLFEGEILHILPLPKGIIFAYLKETTEDNKMLVAYQMISFEAGTATRVANKIYQLSKFGSNHQSFEMQVKNHLTCRTVNLENSKIFVVEDDGSAKILDSDATAVWVGTLRYKGEAPADIALHGHTLWASFSRSNALVRFNLRTMREELRIGGGKDESSFSSPAGLWVEGDKMMVCNQGSHKLWQVDLKTYAVYEYQEFLEPVTQYVKVGGAELVVLHSGIYVL